jgi:hypothetical protein
MRELPLVISDRISYICVKLSGGTIQQLESLNQNIQQNSNYKKNAGVAPCYSRYIWLHMHKPTPKAMQRSSVDLDGPKGMKTFCVHQRSHNQAYNKCIYRQGIPQLGNKNTTIGKSMRSIQD